MKHGRVINSFELAGRTLQLEEVPFSQLVDYWKSVDHFLDPAKVYTENLGYLGPFESTIRDPRRISYGLMDKGEMVGATHVTEWNTEWHRFRTINVREEYRGNDMAWKILRSAIISDWQSSSKLFGWFRKSAYEWALKHGFGDVDGIWHGNHIGVVKPVCDIIEDRKERT